jgi:predicted nucleotidyltransferase
MLEIMKRYPMLANLRVFGSVARGDDTEKSDIDFLVDALPGTTLFNLGGAQVELERLFGVPVHLLASDELPPQLLNASLQEAVPV